MAPNDIMSEYEGALFSAIVILGDALVRLGASESELLSKFKEARNDANTRGQLNETATLDLLIKFLFEPPRFFIPGDKDKT